MIKIYHNPRCSKSREALQLLVEKGLEHEVINYMDNPLTEEELTDLLDSLGMDAFELIRTNEQIWKNEFADMEMDDTELILLMIEFPQLMERPIIWNDDRAVVARPAAKMDEVI
jgi:arsenate reductase